MSARIFVTRITTERDEPDVISPNGSQTVTAFATVDGVEYQVYAWELNWSPAYAKLAARLVEALKAQKALTELTLKTRPDGSKYVTASCHVIGRYMNADLKRIGF